jgi:type VI protein secretion system component VasF
LRLSWPLLQIAYTRSTTGGDDFYRFAGELRAQAGTPSFVFEVYYFCLEHGFVGRYANDLVAIERYQQWLREAIELPRVSTETTDTAETSVSIAKPVPAWTAYVISLAAVVLVTATMTLLSNY